MSNHHYKFNVKMGCPGCSNAIQEALGPLSGLKSLDISLGQQTVSVIAEPSLSYNAVLAAIKGKGKAVHSGEIDGVPQSI
ncbi:metal homeostasis factor ATX1 [Aspergillus bombycis]|uniref:Metal homeostasis factor ATX1 n=1 Tax=Aspergillus bombycis TaxID=109264 RepID=A0A1F8AC06_9EURO|nr:metal homeostasis factor ATX1 [Aspergillus bombycis]OGM48975.1 metal homeostasis factor ATX1 [Aspergillus bombycis]